jgi:hypothetical protein
VRCSPRVEGPSGGQQVAQVQEVERQLLAQVEHARDEVEAKQWGVSLLVHQGRHLQAQVEGCMTNLQAESRKYERLQAVRGRKQYQVAGLKWQLQEGRRQAAEL